MVRQPDQRVRDRPLHWLRDNPLALLQALASLGRPTWQGWGATIGPMAALGSQSTLALHLPRWTRGLAGATYADEDDLRAERGRPRSNPLVLGAQLCCRKPGLATLAAREVYCQFLKGSPPQIQDARGNQEAQDLAAIRPRIEESASIRGVQI